ncbi:MAG TPA: hypothetical protein VFF30_04405 [Nitrososphaerales archaeon]|nr:hypothetical protein [Nitrososphaerales archaeon]
MKESNSLHSSKYSIDWGTIAIKRNVGAGTHKFSEIFSGFATLRAVRDVFGDKTEQVLRDLTVEVFPRDGYMGVSDEDGHVFASQTYLNTGELWTIYLDIVHELVHVKQFTEGKNLFDDAYAYVDRPTEVEAYRVAANEARRVGLDELKIFEYLKVPWITRKEHERLALNCGVPAEVIESSKRRRVKQKH